MTEPSVGVARPSHDVGGVECRACDWCRAVVAKEDLVAHLEFCDIRKWAQGDGFSLERPCICPECGMEYDTNDEAYDCLATCYREKD